MARTGREDGGNQLIFKASPEQDDMENFNYATDGSRGVVARRYTVNYDKSLG